MRTVLTVSLAVALLASLPVPARAIPAWARKYNMNCSGCHYPAPPRLNAQGLRFRWAGYRMPDEMGEPVNVSQLANYISANGRVAWTYEKTAGAPTTGNGVALDGVALWYAGALGRSYSAFVEWEREAADNLGVIVQVGGVWGHEQSYGGFRVGQMHALFEAGIAGFDRTVGLSDPLPVGPVTAGVPFNFGEHQLGAEGFYVIGRDRLSVMVLNGVTAQGEMAESDRTQKDFVLTNQLLLDRHGSGVYAAVYGGTVIGLDPAAAAAASHFVRVAVSASKVFGNVEVLGGLVYGRDSDLPTGAGLPFPTARINGTGYWVSGQYALGGNGGALFGRYEFVDPNRDVAADGVRRYVFGGVLPLTLPQYLRATAEVSRDQPQASGQPATTRAAAGFTLTF